MEHNRNSSASESRAVEGRPASDRALAGGAEPQALLAAPPAPAPPPALRDSFDPVPLRYRHDGWTPAKQRAFIEALADTLCPAAAAAGVGMSERSAFELRRRAGAEGFSAAWDAALRLGVRHRVRSAALDKAVNGTIVRRFYHGKLVAEERVYSERLLIMLLEKGEKLFGGGAESEAMLDDWDGGMERLERGMLSGGWRIWRDRRGRRLTNFPPPVGFADYWMGAPGEPGYERALTAEEEAALDARAESRLEDGAAARDRFFGLAPGWRAADRFSRSKRQK